MWGHKRYKRSLENKAFLHANRRGISQLRKMKSNQQMTHHSLTTLVIYNNFSMVRNINYINYNHELNVQQWERIYGHGVCMVTSSNGNIFRVTGPLCGEFTGPGEFPAQRPVTRSFDVFFDLCLNKDWVNNRKAGDLRRHGAHCDVIVMVYCLQNIRMDVIYNCGQAPVQGKICISNSGCICSQLVPLVVRHCYGY